MDRPVSRQTRSRDRQRNLLKVVAIVAVLVLAFLGLRALLTPEVNVDTLRLAEVQRGDMESTILASGKIVPLYEMVLNAPIEAEIRQVRAKTGSKVQAGDTLLNLDMTFIQWQYDRHNDQLALKKNNVELLKMQYRKQLKDLEIENQMQELKLSRLKSTLKDIQELEAIGGTTGEEVRQAEMNVRIAALEKEKLQEELDYQKKSLQGNLTNLELEVQIQEKTLNELAQKISLSHIRPIQDGVVTWINQALGEKVREGDPLVRVANLRHFKVEAAVTDRHLDKLVTGMPLRVRIGKTFLPGRITSILPEVQQNKVSFEIALQNDSSQLLRPSMEVEVIIPTEKKTGVLLVANGAAFTGAAQQDVFVVQDGRAEKRSVKIGLTNGEQVELIGDVQEGDQVIISSTKTFDHRTSFYLDENP